MSRSQEEETRVRFLSYQPPGNGWNNQRVALENALVLAKLLNRTLIVHPLAPHQLGSKLKAGHHPGYVAYNMLNETNLLPLAHFIDLELLSQLVPVIAINTSHTQFIRDYNGLSWRNVCHSTGFGYWVDQVPQSWEEVEMLSEQRFISSSTWRQKCPEEQERVLKDPSPIVRYVSELNDEEAEMLYFEQGTLFGIHIRFTTRERALEAQNWVVRHVRYKRAVWERVEKIAARLKQYNAIHVHRKMHIDSRLTQNYWIDRMVEKNFSKDFPVYVATDEDNLFWFDPFRAAGYKLYFAVNFSDIFEFTNQFAPSLRSDLLAVHEQCLCEKAVQLVPSPASTFAGFILRHRHEVKTRDGLMMDTLHTYWIGHQIAHTHSHEHVLR